MKISHIEIENFRSFDKQEFDLNDFNVIIGPNASGKSNLTQIFKFLRDLFNFGIDKAIQLQMGLEYFRNINIGNEKDFRLKFVFEFPESDVMRYHTVEKGKKFVNLVFYKGTYEFSLRFHKRGLGFSVVQDFLEMNGKIEDTNKNGKEKKPEEFYLNLQGNNSKIKITLESDESVRDFLKEQLLFPYIKDLYSRSYRNKTLIIESPIIDFIIYPSILDLFKEIKIFDIDPKLPKNAIPISGLTELSENGDNLALALKDLLGDKKSNKKISNLLKFVLPFAEHLGIEKFLDKSLLISLQESYNQQKMIPASLISDGTMNIICLIIILYFSGKGIIIIEEPERNIHPSLIQKIMELFNEVSKKKQIIITTHNPELIKQIRIEDLITIHRTAEGFSKIENVKNKESIKKFLSNEIGLNELFIDNIL